MRKIKNIEKITSVYNAWKPSDIAFVKALEWSINNLVIIFYCQLRNSVNGWPDTSKAFFEISINFKNVTNLKFDFNGSGLHQVSGFDIIDVSENGLEKINFQIEDYENGSIEFSCEEVEINTVSNPSFVAFDQEAAKTGGSLVQANRTAGNLFRDELATALRAEGRTVNTEVFKRTPFGPRYMDLDVWHNGVNLGGIETKVGASRYLPLQRLKDAWLGANGYPVNLVRKPGTWQKYGYI